MRAPGRLLLAVGLLLVASAAVPHAHSSDYMPTRLFFTVYGDGVVDVDYMVDVDPTLVKVKVPVFGAILRDVLVVDQDGIPSTTPSQARSWRWTASAQSPSP